MLNSISEVIRDSKAYLCMECGKCTGMCPISRFNHSYSPRVLVNKAIRTGDFDLLKDKNIWNCLTCGLCNEKCPAGINYIDLTLVTRFEASKIGEEAVCSHGGAAQSLMRIMTTPDLKQNRMDWISKDLKVTDDGEVIYFVGCLPYFDVLLADVGTKTVKIAKAAVKILNHLGITPVILPDERCCGHDLLWNGDFENFKKLAEHNIKEIKKSGAKKIVFSCPEGYRTFKKDYTKYFDFDIEVLYITKLVNENIANGKLKLKSFNKIVTYQDSCRLGRHMGIYNEPREVLSNVPDLKLVEMSRSKNRSMCCGVSAWMNCSIYSKSIQTARLKEAKNTNADYLVLSCPKCEIHFNCAMKESPSSVNAKEIKINTVNETVLIADLLEDK